ncbi:MAG TPA: M12 family metallo-peptidase, partial [candidate division Zixibacteria bacterium]|nr:M12 family metallo-peptidase [candidate division Zixibacteria bacterium]
MSSSLTEYNRVFSAAAVVKPFTIENSNSDKSLISVSINSIAYQELKSGSSSPLVAIPLTKSAEVILELERFEIITPEARFFSGLSDAPRPDVVLFRGKVSGERDSHAYLSITSKGHASGYVTLDGLTYYISRPPGQDLSIISTDQGGAELPAFAEYCGVGDGNSTGLKSTTDSRGLNTTSAGPQVAIIALDADQKFYNIFGDLVEAENYLIQLLGAVSDIYLRDVNMKLMTSFIRIWSAGGEPFNQNDLGSFQDYWNNNEDLTGLDLIHLITGRRDLGFGGIAYVSAFCSESRYSISGFINGSFPSPFGSTSINNWDVIVMAHELGHNFGTFHTHDISQYDPRIDSCAQDFPSLGTIMSYCHIHPGYVSNIETRFPLRVQHIIELTVVNGSDCFWHDCNGNGIDDAVDIAGPTSNDINFNGIPDECEDCNGNSILDPIDIAGASDDENENGIPDECEPDCDGSGTPDELEAYFLTDIDDDGLLDVCESDCNANDTADFIEIADGRLTDYDRNTIPDICQDCNSNSIPDWIDLEREFNL